LVDPKDLTRKILFPSRFLGYSVLVSAASGWTPWSFFPTLALEQEVGYLQPSCPPWFCFFFFHGFPSQDAVPLTPPWPPTQKFSGLYLFPFSPPQDLPLSPTPSSPNRGDILVPSSVVPSFFYLFLHVPSVQRLVIPFDV